LKLPKILTSPNIALDTHPATPIEFAPLSHPPQRTPHRTHGTVLLANSPELELAQAHPERDGLRRDNNRQPHTCSKGIHHGIKPFCFFIAPHRHLANLESRLI
jgi:hypothetical protein